jgi:hypothetical protein
MIQVSTPETSPDANGSLLEHEDTVTVLVAGVI